jgi:beta-lactamase regulating signal transducer with metallopeptidase domain
MSALINTLLEITVYSAILFLVIILFKKVFHKRISASLNYMVWLLLVVRLLMPFTVDSGIRLFVIPEDKAPAVHTGTEGASDFSFRTGSGTESEGYAYPLQPPQNTWTDADSGSPETNAPVPAAYAVRFDWQTAVVLIWALGMIGYFAYIALLHMRFRRVTRRRSADISASMLAMVDACRKELGIKTNIPVMLQSGITSPAITLSLRPVLLLPISMLGAMSRAQIELGIRHELIHYKRGDHLMRLLLMLVRGVYWFNPAVWIAHRMILTDMETACDARVTASMEKKREIYISIPSSNSEATAMRVTR